MSVSDIEEEMREIYEIELSTSAISIITNKVNQAAQEWQNRPLDPVYLIAWMDGIVFKVRDNGKIINKTVYLCVGLKQNGLKEVLGRIPSARIPLVIHSNLCGTPNQSFHSLRMKLLRRPCISH